VHIPTRHVTISFPFPFITTFFLVHPYMSSTFNPTIDNTLITIVVLAALSGVLLCTSCAFYLYQKRRRRRRLHQQRKYSAAYMNKIDPYYGRTSRSGEGTATAPALLASLPMRPETAMTLKGNVVVTGNSV
jgi:hypothetical protein